MKQFQLVKRGECPIRLVQKVCALLTLTLTFFVFDRSFAGIGSPLDQYESLINEISGDPLYAQILDAETQIVTTYNLRENPGALQPNVRNLAELFMQFEAKYDPRFRNFAYEFARINPEFVVYSSKDASGNYFVIFDPTSVLSRAFDYDVLKHDFQPHIRGHRMSYRPFIEQAKEIIRLLEVSRATANTCMNFFGKL